MLRQCNKYIWSLEWALKWTIQYVLVFHLPVIGLWIFQFWQSRRLTVLLCLPQEHISTVFHAFTCSISLHIDVRIFQVHVSLNQYFLLLFSVGSSSIHRQAATPQLVIGGEIVLQPQYKWLFIRTRSSQRTDYTSNWDLKKPWGLTVLSLLPLILRPVVSTPCCSLISA